ncbi:MAG: AI-2E family transporter [gamma proteobacterium symbiont of Bathyaustriella thionipta]|nr:AI-2E family transporter [gamma proteobacterium symbiont of Bathyaustriella thionipta]
MQIIIDWFKRALSDQQIVALAIFVLVLFSIVLFMGHMLAPVLAGLVIAYLLEGLVVRLERLHIPRLISVFLVFLSFMLFVIMVVVVLLPSVYSQLEQLVQQLPQMALASQQAFMQLPEKYPGVISELQIAEVMQIINRELAQLTQNIVSTSLASVINLIAIIVYLILVPLLILFFLKDKVLILQWLSRFLPEEHSLISDVWKDVERQLANYVRGKFWEILIVASSSIVAFTIFDLKYAILLGVLVGLSVIVPYIGAAAVTLPIVLVAWFQWGWSSDFMWLTITYLIIQALDGNVLVPLLFSEVVSLHPVAIIVAILVFGGLWGFWGVFFAIPLATLVQSILTAFQVRQGSDRLLASNP